MSKSLGNVIDPLDVMEGIPLQGLDEKLLRGNLDPKELNTARKFQKTSFPNGIPECGADAVRFSLVNYTTGGGDINFDVNVIHGYRRFCNKIYQATKYVLSKLDKTFIPQKHPARTEKESLPELWILHKLNSAAREVNAALSIREFRDATSIIYTYWYNYLCDIYIENSKSILQDGTSSEQESAKQTLYTALEGALTMIHPLMPFLTEELWQRLPRRPEDSTPSIVVASYPEYKEEFHDPAAAEAYDLVLSISKSIRSLAAEYAIKDNTNIYIRLSNAKALETCKAQLASIKKLGGKATMGENASITILGPSDPEPAGCVAQSITAVAAAHLLVKGRVDIDGEIEKAKTKMVKASEMVKKQRKMIEGDGWAKMKREVQENETKKLEDAEGEVRVLEGTINRFERLKLE